jgi:hypothetical protein
MAGRPLELVEGASLSRWAGERWQAGDAVAAFAADGLDGRRLPAAALSREDLPADKDDRHHAEDGKRWDNPVINGRRKLRRRGLEQLVERNQTRKPGMKHGTILPARSRLGETGSRGRMSR